MNNMSEHINESDNAVVFMTDNGVCKLTIQDMIKHETKIKQREKDLKKALDLCVELKMKNDSFETKIKQLEAEIEIFRYLLWLRHGHNELYGDDGEMQCSQCLIDFKRDSAQKIDERFVKLALEGK